MTFLNKLLSFKWMFVLVVGVGFTFFSGGALADGTVSTSGGSPNDWAGVLQKGDGLLTAGKKFIVGLAYFLGTGLFFLGLWWVYKDGKEEGRGHMKNGITAIIIGALLLIFPTTVGWTIGSTGAGSSAVKTENFSSF